MIDIFNFPDTTPELAALLAHGDAYRTGSEWRAEHQRLESLVPPGLLRRYRHELKAWRCRDETIARPAKDHMSPSGRYRLSVSNHTTGEGTWEYSKGRVFDGDRLIATVCRNYHAFPFCFVEGHPKGDFLICGEDYQGNTVVDLATGEVRSAPTPHGFCWASMSVSPSRRTIAVDGCFWAGPYEVVFADFSDPTVVPLPELGRFFADDVEWIADEPDTAVMNVEREVHRDTGRSREEMSEDERDAADEADAWCEEKTVGERWVRPA